MTVAEWIARFLSERDVDTVFEVAGGMIALLIDALHRDDRIRIVSCHHEQAAGFAAEGHARITGIPGVALATSGPGAINLLTPLASCHYDSVPAVFLTGQVNRSEQKQGRAVRQLGFQETDIVTMAEPVTKGAWRVTAPEDVPRMLADAFKLAVAGRPGPVLVDLPFDLQRADLGEPRPSAESSPDHQPVEMGRVEFTWDELVRELGRAPRPLILAGGGVRAAGATDGVRSLARALCVPVVHSLMAVDVLPEGDPLRVGLIGTYGNRWANMALTRCDVLVVLGSRLDVRQTGADVAAFARGRTIYHVDVDPAEVNNRLSGCRAAICPLQRAVPQLVEAARAAGPAAHDAWRAEIAELERAWPDVGELTDVEGINPNVLMHELSCGSRPAAYVADVGQHQMWAAQSLELSAKQRFLTSGGLGAMGSGLPIAVGACLALAMPVVLVAGDGGFQLNLQELQTVVRNRLPIKIVILNNRAHGMVRQFQDSYFGGRHQSTVWGYSTPDFAAVASAYGIPSRRIATTVEVPAAIDALWTVPGPSLLEVTLDQRANVYPKLAFGRPLSEMEPLVRPRGLGGT